MATQPSDSSKYRVRTTAPDELAVIAQRAQAFTNASGAAIALSEGSADEIVCRARSGSSAPDIGVSLRVEGSFTGICIQTGKELRCDDAETDTRVDSMAIRALGIRSMVVTPIKDENRIAGVLAVFAPTPHAFTITHVAVLKTMADQIAIFLQKDRRAKEEGVSPEAPAVTMSKPPVAAAPPAPPPAVLAPTPIKASFSGGAASAPALARAVAPVTPLPIALAPVAPKIEPLKPIPVAAEIAIPAPLPRREEKPREEKFEEKRIDFRSESSIRPSFGTLDAVAAEPAGSGGKKAALIGIAAIAVIAGAVTAAYFTMHKVAPSVAATPPVQPAQNAAAPLDAANAQSGAVVPPAAGVSAPPQPGGAGTANPKPDKTEGKKAEPSQRKIVNPETQAQNQPVPETPEAVTLSTGPSKIVPIPPPQQSSPDVAPPPVVGGSSSASALGSLTQPQSRPTPAMVAMVAQSEIPPSVLRKVSPSYPPIAKLQRASGTVVVRVKVGVDGKVNNPQFISGPVVFKEAAFEAVRQWLYKPATLNGKPIEQDAEIKLNFHPI